MYTLICWLQLKNHFNKLISFVYHLVPTVALTDRFIKLDTFLLTGIYRHNRYGFLQPVYLPVGCLLYLYVSHKSSLFLPLLNGSANRAAG